MAANNENKYLRERIEELEYELIERQEKHLSLFVDEDLFKKNIFHYFEDLLCDLEMRTLHVNNLDDAKKCFSKRILMVEKMPRVLDVKLRRLGQRTHEHGNPICVIADLTLERLLPSEIDVFKNVIAGRYSDYVSICEMDSGTAFLDFSDSLSFISLLIAIMNLGKIAKGN
ncbi:hypothetical protein GNP44_11910 [Aliivibrio fischeri]|uniref:hypothetical protein n=1 Tax=Aliivibrio fischeri TaxID=668 RepID=UPI00084CC894|nr:hypothetical protein [Aliivibrio fischeri]MUK30777.1 hypothetical protein [Aliivibrio fischeri]OED51202.1 hypothetical protein BEI46_06975 [Aliivibrio fischeri]